MHIGQINIKHHKINSVFGDKFQSIGTCIRHFCYNKIMTRLGKLTIQFGDHNIVFNDKHTNRFHKSASGI